MAEATPDYLQYADDDSHVDVTLTRAIEIAGMKTSTVRMREPSVQDQMAANSMKGTEASKEVAFVANLCDLTPADVSGLSLRNYGRLQAALGGFID